MNSSEYSVKLDTELVDGIQSTFGSRSSEYWRPLRKSACNLGRDGAE